LTRRNLLVVLGVAGGLIVVGRVSACIQGRPLPFDKKLWDLRLVRQGDRYRMARDLIERRALIGKSRAEVEAILGPAETMRYPLRREFDNFDAIAGDDLVLDFDASSKVAHAEIVKWKRK
jgi:hypothetical protein